MVRVTHSKYTLPAFRVQQIDVYVRIERITCGTLAHTRHHTHTHKHVIIKWITHAPRHSAHVYLIICNMHKCVRTYSCFGHSCCVPIMRAIWHVRVWNRRFYRGCCMRNECDGVSLFKKKAILHINGLRSIARQLCVCKLSSVCVWCYIEKPPQNLHIGKWSVKIFNPGDHRKTISSTCPAHTSWIMSIYAHTHTVHDRALTINEKIYISDQQRTHSSHHIFYLWRARNDTDATHARTLLVGLCLWRTLWAYACKCTFTIHAYMCACSRDNTSARVLNARAPHTRTIIPIQRTNKRCARAHRNSAKRITRISNYSANIHTHMSEWVWTVELHTHTIMYTQVEVHAKYIIL